VGALISNSQNAFLGRRQILDLVLIANECLDSRLRSEFLRFYAKLNLEKAFDHFFFISRKRLLIMLIRISLLYFEAYGVWL
jgi:hypothetical protein